MTKSNDVPEFYKILKENNFDQIAILLCGMEKSGNTWTRFVIYNYFNILLNDIGRTLTFDELSQIAPHSLYLKKSINLFEKNPTRYDFVGTIAPFEVGFPIIYNTHEPYHKNLGLFNQIIYVYRQPLDTMVSNYYFWLNRKIPFKAWPVEHRSRMENINFFVLSSLPFWIKFQQVIVQPGSIKVSYDKARQNPHKIFGKLLQSLGVQLDFDVLGKSIAYSSFENINQMAKETNQTYGVANPKDFTGTFLRSGRTGQYMNELSPETIRQSLKMLRDAGISEEIISP